MATLSNACSWGHVLGLLQARDSITVNMWTIFIVTILAPLCRAEDLFTNDGSQGIRLQEILERGKLQACDRKWTALFVNHTMCLNDLGTQVVLDEKTKVEIVQLHNDIRSQVVPRAANMRKLIWDEELATIAGKWARQCTAGHDTTQMRLAPSLPGFIAGQNMAAGYRNFTSAIQAWYSEIKDFVYGSTGAKSMHYTQIINAKNQRVGCGQALCPDEYSNYYVCNYDYIQSGSEVKVPYKNSSASCSDCPGSCGANGKLCNCDGKACFNGGTLNVDTCTCTCSTLYTGDTCQILTCPTKDPFYCGTQWPPSYCGIYSNVPTSCPYMCGKC